MELVAQNEDAGNDPPQPSVGGDTTEEVSMVCVKNVSILDSWLYREFKMSTNIELTNHAFYLYILIMWF